MSNQLPNTGCCFQISITTGNGLSILRSSLSVWVNYFSELYILYLLVFCCKLFKWCNTTHIRQRLKCRSLMSRSHFIAASGLVLPSNYFHFLNCMKDFLLLLLLLMPLTFDQRLQNRFLLLKSFCSFRHCCFFGLECIGVIIY